MKINHLAFVIASMSTAEAFAASNLLITKTAAGLTVTRSPHTPKISSGTIVTLTAQGIPSGYKAVWSGVNCSNGSTCTFTMPNNVTTVNLSSVKVATSPPPKPIPPQPKPVPIINYNLKVSVSPSGAGTVTPSSGTYKANTTVIISQSSTSDYAFIKWSDAKCGTFLSCRLTITGNANLTANFVKKLAQPTLNLPVQNKTDVKKDTRFTLKSALLGASQYELVVFKDGSNIALNAANPCQDVDVSLCKSLKKTTYPFDLSMFLKEDGTKYQWRVRAIDSNAVAGNWSDARTFTMASDKLPDFTAFVVRKYVFNGGNGYCRPQCVDLIKDTFNLTTNGHAYSYWTNDTLSAYGYSKNINGESKSPPRPGDVLVWNTNIGKGFGHVAIIRSVDVVAKKVIYAETNENGNCNYLPNSTKTLTLTNNGAYTINSSHLYGWWSKK